MFSPPMHCESKGSPSPEKTAPEQDSKAGCKDKCVDPAFPQVYEQPRHIQYATHFPIPQVRPSSSPSPAGFCLLWALWCLLSHVGDSQQMLQQRLSFIVTFQSFI